MNNNVMIGGIGEAIKLTKAQEFWIQRMGTKQFPLTETVGNLWKPRGKKIYVEKGYPIENVKVEADSIDKEEDDCKDKNSCSKE